MVAACPEILAVLTGNPSKKHRVWNSPVVTPCPCACCGPFAARESTKRVIDSGALDSDSSQSVSILYPRVHAPVRSRGGGLPEEPNDAGLIPARFDVTANLPLPYARTGIS